MDFVLVDYSQLLEFFISMITSTSHRLCNIIRVRMRAAKQYIEMLKILINIFLQTKIIRWPKSEECTYCTILSAPNCIIHSSLNFLIFSRRGRF